MRLCSFCSHLRPRHLLYCSDSDDNVRFGSIAETDQNCEFCSLLSGIVYQELVLLHLLPDHALFHGNIALRFNRSKLASNSVAEKVEREFRWILESYIQPDQAELMIEMPKLQLHRHSVAYGYKLDPVVVSPFVDWNVLLSWLNIPDIQTAGNWHSRVPHIMGLRVIDALYFCVIEAPKLCKYITLSYVWGDPAMYKACQATRDNSEALQTPGSLKAVSMPATLLDAIVACRALGYRYLWIDALCIPQDDPVKKAEQINRMDRIYRCAELCIVAAAGSDASHGLPGVGRSRVWRSFSTRVFDLELATVRTSVIDCVNRSVWNKRAWTFQESLLSRRLLYFTELGVFYQDRQHSGSDTTYVAEYPSRSDDLYSVRHLSTDRYDAILEQYTIRKLSFEQDILRAVAGVLIHHLDGKVFYGMSYTEFDRAIAWKSSDPSGVRRESLDSTSLFPSWSWASAYGKISIADEAYSVACWGVHEYWKVAGLPEKGTEITLMVPPRVDPDDETIPDEDMNIAAGLAWAHGCVESECPDDVLFDCSAEAYVARLRRRWSNFPDYWHDVFGRHLSGSSSEIANSPFSAADIKAASSVPGRILLRTQEATFSARLSVNPVIQGRYHILIEGSSGVEAGIIPVTSDLRDRWLNLKRERIRLVALATGTPEELLDYYNFEGVQMSGGNTKADNLRPEVAFRDHEGEAITHGPQLMRVMLVESVDKNAKDDRIVQRIAIGVVYLRQWILAERQFKTLILE